ncbi:hypothetical protein ACH5RR_032461 [Cinchona calisaya]|uniref:Uncharacterized protein n=1 Tax=Cinchona calisaya TaxID=153742 RepID=A0ABD2YKQ0_9GENT
MMEATPIKMVATAIISPQILVNIQHASSLVAGTISLMPQLSTRVLQQVPSSLPNAPPTRSLTMVVENPIALPIIVLAMEASTYTPPSHAATENIIVKAFDSDISIVNNLVPGG